VGAAATNPAEADCLSGQSQGVPLERACVGAGSRAAALSGVQRACYWWLCSSSADAPQRGR
jgi:hypothetical protein